VESEWPVWVLEAATRVEDLGVLDRLDERLRAAGFTSADLRSEGDRVGVFLGMPVAEHGDPLDTLFRLVDAEQFRHEAAAAKIKEAKLRQRATDEREEGRDG
jgi:uncharacterized protein (DUF58 family)